MEFVEKWIKPCVSGIVFVVLSSVSSPSLKLAWSYQLINVLIYVLLKSFHSEHFQDDIKLILIILTKHEQILHKI